MSLEGIWKVKRTGGLLPPLVGVRKRISGASGQTCVGRLVRARFRVDGLALRYLSPFAGFVDLLDEEQAGVVHGRATFRGKEFGRFAMTRIKAGGTTTEITAHPS
jgi:hypothetical protein